VNELGFVGGGHHHHAGEAGEVGYVERAGMGRSIRPDQPCPVDGEANRQMLDGDVMHHLVVGSLQEGRVDGGKRLEALGGQTSGEGHGVLLGDADIEASFGKNLGEAIEPRA
jgi:hypothetical protein